MTTDVPEGSRRRDALIALGLAALGTVLVLWANASPRLPGLTSDSIQYLEGARSIARLESPTIPVGPWSQPATTSPLVHYPPGFSIAMAGPVALGAETTTAAVVVMALAAGATLALTFLIGGALAGVSGGLFAVALVGLYPEWARLHTAVWSEPLYLALVLLTVLVLLRAPGRAGVHGLLAMACLAVRYVGVAMGVLAAAVALTGPRAGRARRLVLALGPSVLAMAAWAALLPRGGSTSRQLGVYGGWGRWAGGLPNVFAQWAAPAGGTVVAVVALTACALVLARSAVWRDERGRAFLRIAAATALLHLVTLVASRAFLDPRIPMDARMLLPVVVLLAIAVGAALGRVFAQGRVPAAIATAAVAAWAVGGARVIGPGVAAIKETGQYYTHATWEASVPVKWAESAVASGLVVYSNEPELMYLYTGRPARQTPVRGEDLEAWKAAWQARPGPLVMLNPPRPVDLPAGPLLDGIPVQLLEASPEGAVFWR